MRMLLTVLLGAGLALVLLAVFGVAHLRSSLPERDGRVGVPGLDSPVEVLWDEHAVPRVRAGSLEDLLMAQGFLHARDRLWQMELVRRAIQGRLAEVMGEEALEADRFMRRLGLWRATAEAEAVLDPVERRLLQAYADGVNAALEEWSGSLPPEFVALRFRPEPWTPRHSLAVAKMMSFTLSAYTDAVRIARAVRRIGPERARYLAPAYPDWGATILPPEPPITPPLAAALVDAYSVATASNSWVVSGQRTRSGRPLLANDPHLGFQAPGTWYLMGLHAAGPDGMDVVGATLPGAPLVIIGRNAAVAWGFTNAYVDDADLFIERLDPDDPGRYLVPGGSAPFEVVAETLHVRGRETPEVMETRWTRRGPVLPEPDGPGGDEVLSVAWATLGPSTVFRAVLGLNRAEDWRSFVRAVRDMDDPHQNIVYADTAGRIGYAMGGRVPIRGDRRPPPAAPVPGWTGEWDWSGTLPFEEHPQALNPAQGFIVTANNRQAAGAAADLVTSAWMEPFRAMRIEEMIRQGSDLDAEAMRVMQLDTRDLLAARYRDRAVEAAVAEGLGGAARRLRDWDLEADAESRDAPLFYAWYEVFRQAAARDLYQGEAGYFPRGTVADVLERRTLPWREDGAAAYEALAREAMREAVELAAGRTWGESNHYLHAHSLGSVAALERLLRLNIGPAPHRGAPTTVNVAHYAYRSLAEGFPFTTTAGVSLRFVADLGNTDGAGGFVTATGQSGNPLSRHYSDLTRLWSEGRLLRLPLGGAGGREEVEDRMILEPEPTDDR